MKMAKKRGKNCVCNNALIHGSSSRKVLRCRFTVTFPPADREMCILCVCLSFGWCFSGSFALLFAFSVIRLKSFAFQLKWNMCVTVDMCIHTERAECTHKRANNSLRLCVCVAVAQIENFHKFTFKELKHQKLHTNFK